MPTKKELQLELAKLLEEKEKREKYNKIDTFFPDEGPYRRELYPKHIQFLNAGSKYIERAFIAGNRVGKTQAGCYELTMHLTGNYPKWWKGKRFHRPITAWVCGDRGEVIRDGIQKTLFGSVQDPGSGLIPKKSIVGKPSSMPGVPNAIGQAFVKHTSGGISEVTVKTYRSGQEAFESAAIDVIMLDEECPFDIYTECLMRILSTKGILYLTFTPDSGLTDTVMHFFKDGNFESGTAQGKFITMVGWDDVPHLDDKTKEELLKTIPPHAVDARTKGIPYLGSGAVYPVNFDEVVVRPFAIPDYWPRCYGLDVGWTHPTAVVWCALDRDTDTVYVYSEYRKAQEEPRIHAIAIKDRGTWIPGVADPASSGSSQSDGKRVIDGYYYEGLDLTYADNSLEAGIHQVLTRLSSGRLKIFATCPMLLHELKLYRRDDDGKVVDKLDDLACALRYAIMSGLDRADTEPMFNDTNELMETMNRNETTGY